MDQKIIKRRLMTEMVVVDPVVDPLVAGFELVKVGNDTVRSNVTIPPPPTIPVALHSDRIEFLTFVGACVFEIESPPPE